MKKTLTVLLALVLVIAMSVAGTMAYLTSEDSVTNTFTVGNVKITLDEAKASEYGVADNTVARVQKNEYKLIPGHSYTKDPIIHVAANSEDCYLFVKVVNGIKDYEAAGATTIAAQMEANWKVVDANNGIYVYALDDAEKTVVSKNSNVTVFESFKIDGNAQLPASGNGLDVVVTAYAVQADGFADMAAADIWTTAGFATT